MISSNEFLVIPAMATAFIITAAFMFALRPVSKSIGLVDVPGGRKSHIGRVPIIGGLAMFAGVFAALSVVGISEMDLPSLFVAATILIVVGALDDRYSLPASARVAAQIGSVLIMFFGAGLKLADIGDPFGFGTIDLGVFTLIGTLLVSLTVVNAYNLIDGVDGLAGSLALIALLAISSVAALNSPEIAIALITSAAIFGFLLFNFPVTWNRPVRSFMGDAGSTFLGLTILWTTLSISQGSDRLISPVYCLWFASIPIYDLLTCFVRRSFAGKSPFSPGRDHLHHTLKRGGLGMRQVLAVMAGFQLAYTVFALVAYHNNVPEYVMFFLWITLAAIQRHLFRLCARQYRIYRIRHHRSTT